MGIAQLEFIMARGRQVSETRGMQVCQGISARLRDLTLHQDKRSPKAFNMLLHTLVLGTIPVQGWCGVDKHGDCVVGAHGLGRNTFSHSIRARSGTCFPDGKANCMSLRSGF